MQPIDSLLAAGLLAFATHSAALGGLAELNVFDRIEGRRLPIHWHEGRAFVVGKPGNEYQVTIRSRLGEELLAVVSVDGVNVITGDAATPEQSGYVLAPWRSLDIGGWRKSLERTAAFYFTPLADSYAARTGRPDHVGVIGVALFRKKAPDPQPISRLAPLARSEADASQSGRAAAEARSSAPRDERLGTGHGRSETSHARYVSFERASSSPAETVTIYYDSYRNLVARGVLPPTIAPRPPLPHPFPGFVPDPGA